MYASIIPLWKSLWTDALLYRTDQILPVWSLVEIPYGTSEQIGIVAGFFWDIDVWDNTKIKNINATISSKPLLASYQFAMIESISRRYMIPIHRILQIFLSRPVYNRLHKKDFEQILEHQESRQSVPTIRELHILQHGVVMPENLESYLQDGTVVIFPDDLVMMPYKTYFHDRDDIHYIENDATPTKRSQWWIDVKNKKYPIICWPRRLLYYNLSRYQHIIYLEDTISAYYWHYPIKIAYTDILRILSDTSTLSITLLTSIPTLTTLSRFRDFILKNI